MRKTEKQRIDFDLDFFIGFASGIAANIIAQVLYEKLIVPMLKKDKGMGKMTFMKATRNLWGIITGRIGTGHSPLEPRPKTQRQWGGVER